MENGEPNLEPSAAAAGDAQREHLDRLARRGIKALISRQVGMQLLTIAAGVVLSRTLGPAVFGIYAIATFFVQVVALFGDFGLAASLVQRREAITQHDLAVVFTVQQFGITLLVAALGICSPLIAQMYDKAPAGLPDLIRAIAFTLFLTSWRTMSQLQLERELRFRVIAWIDVAEGLCYQGLAVALALTGHGVWSLVIAVIAKGVVGLVLARLAAPWPIRLAWDRKLAREVLRYGLPYQLSSIVNHSSAWITPLLVGTLIGPQAVGYLSWASGNGKKPLILVDSVMQVAFPHLARLQGSREDLERAIRGYLGWLLLPSTFWFAAIFCAGRPAVTIIYGPQWTAATPALILTALAGVLDCILWVTGQSLKAIGDAGGELRRVSWRSLVNFGCSAPLVLWLGFLGVPIAYLVAYGASFLAYFGEKGLGRGSFRRVLAPQAWYLGPIVAACAGGAALRRLEWPALAEMFAGLAACAVLYGLAAVLLAPAQVQQGVLGLRRRAWLRWGRADAGA